jgi:hypothetical protein
MEVKVKQKFKRKSRSIEVKAKMALAQKARRKVEFPISPVFLNELNVAINIALNHECIIPKKKFYTATALRKMYGAPAHREYKRWFSSSQVFDTETGDEYDQQLREKKISKEEHLQKMKRCFIWQWKLKLSMILEARRLVGKF